MAHSIRAAAVPALVASVLSVVAQAQLRGAFDVVLAGAPLARCAQQPARWTRQYLLALHACMCAHAHAALRTT